MQKVKKKDYDLVEKISLKYAEKIQIKDQNLNTKEKARLGFYYLGLSLILGIQEISELSEFIIDSSYQSKVNGKNNDDFGIDAVSIDSETKVISLLSFKYREKFENSSTKSVKELQDTIPFLGYLKNNETNLNTKNAALSIEKIREIVDNLRNQADYKCNLYMVSNDCAYFNSDLQSVREFKDTYSWLDIKEINLNEISSHIALKAENNEAKIILHKKELLQHDMDGYVTAHSYVGRVKLIDLIRITSKDIELRKQESIQEEEIVQTQNVDVNILFDNVRGYLGDTNYNRKIINTLVSEPEKFFLFNNGITITAEDIIVEKVNFDEYYKITLKNYQIVNGGQTLRSIYAFKDKNNNLIKNLAQGSILIRFFKTGLEEGLVNKVSEYTNSQNAISGRDLKSVDKIQLDIEKRFEVEGLIYNRKMSKIDVPISDKLDISMEKLGQLLLAYHGHPEKVSNSKKKIFEEYYEKLFNDNPDFMSIAIELVRNYHEILEVYKNNEDKYRFYEQKIFYIIYLKRSFEKNSFEENMILLEQAISEYRNDEDISPPRKLIQTKFKELIESKVKTKGGEKIDPISLKKSN